MIQQPYYTVLKTFEQPDYWTSVELIQGNSTCFYEETFIHSTKHKNREIESFFESDSPHSSLFLLHHFKPKEKKNTRPILLVHGASHNANLAWCRGINGENGLLSMFKHLNFEVFAITFSHSHGDNHLQAIQIRNAILRIQEITNASHVDIIAHSKGGVSTRLYLSNYGEHYVAPFLKNVKKYIMLGTPNNGIDFIFRHELPNWYILLNNINAPIACEKMYYQNTFQDTMNRSIYKESGAFIGQLQMLSKFDSTYPIYLNRTLYYGGENFFIKSKGIDQAITEGGNLIEKLTHYPIDSSVDVYVLAGTKNTFNPMIIGEHTGPSDGLVFTESVLQIEHIVENKKNIKRKTALFLNHLDLIYHPLAKSWIIHSLSED